MIVVKNFERVIFTKNYKRLLSILLTGSMLFSLSACKGSEEIVVDDGETEEITEEEEIIDPETGAVIEYYHPELAKTGVYDITDIDLGFGDGDFYVTDSGRNDNGAYYVVCENDKYWNHAYYVLTLDNEGNMLGRIKLSLPVDIETSEEGDVTSVMEANRDKSGIAYDDVTDLLKENKIRADEVDSVYYEFFNYAGDGIYEAIIRVYTGGWEEHSTEYAFNVRWNEDGECTDILYLPIDSGEGYIDRYVYSPDGRLAVLYDYYVWDDDSNGTRAVVFSADRFDDPQNMVAAQNDDLSGDFVSIGECLTAGDKVIALYESADNSGKVTAAEIDMDTFEPVDPFVVDQLGSGSFYPIGSTDDGQLIFNSISGLQTSKKGEKASVLLDVINSDFREDGCGYFVSIEGSDEFYLSYLSTDGKHYLAYCKKVAPEEVADCNVITFASTVLYGSMIDMIVDFNEKNTGTRIAFKNYQVYEKVDDFNADMDKMYEDMVNGRMADIVYLDPYSNLDIDTLSRKGILADIGKLIEDDPDMSADDYLTNIFDAISYDGKLYRIMPSFSIYSAYGSAEYVAGYENWNVDEFLTYSDGLDPEESLMFTMFETRENFLEDMLKYNGYSWIDRDHCSCDFNDISFLRLVGYAGTMPEEIDFESNHMYNYWNDSEYMLYNGEIRVNLSYMTSYKDAYYNAYSDCKNQPVFVGFPSPESQGSVITYTSYYLLSAESPLLAESWDFIKQVLLSDYQNSDNIFNFPVLKSAFEADMEDCANPFSSVNESGEEYEYMPSYEFEGEWIEVPYMTQEQIGQAEEFVYSIDRLSFEDPELMQIIINGITDGLDRGKTPEEISASVQMAVQEVLDQRKAG